MAPNFGVEIDHKTIFIMSAGKNDEKPNIGMLISQLLLFEGLQYLPPKICFSKWQSFID